MVDIATLKLFCGGFRLNELSTEGDYTYACNGAVILRVPAITGIGAAPDYPKAIKLFQASSSKNEFVPIPIVDMPPLLTCQDCLSVSGTAGQYDCPECDGEGEVTLDSGRHEYVCDCKSCFGDGFVNGPCEECEGTGFIESDLPIRCPINGVDFSQKLIHLLGKLPNCEISVTYPDCSILRFDGGEGLIMPLRAK